MSLAATKTQERLPKSGSSFRASVLHASDGAELVVRHCRDFAFPKHAHQEYTIGLVMSGQEYLYCDGRYHPAIKGNIYFGHPDQVHGGEPVDSGQWTFASLYLSHGFCYEHLDGQVPEFETVPVDDKVSTTLYSDLIATLSASRCDLETGSALISFVRQITRRHSGTARRTCDPNVSAPALQRAREFIRTCFRDPIVLHDIAGLPIYIPGI